MTAPKKYKGKEVVFATHDPDVISGEVTRSMAYDDNI